MTTNKKAVRLIAEICRSRGINKIVLSPGSRSAPLVIAFSSLLEVECVAIPDERVAGYFSLGMAQQLKKPVILFCTSGTAAINLSPAVCEAFYQYIPLLVITADRPKGSAARGENQAIVQENIFGDHILSKYSINGEANSEQELQEVIIQINNAITQTMNGAKGPVHLNVHLEEPLYETTEEALSIEISTNETLSNKGEKKNTGNTQHIKTKLEQAGKKMIIVGMHPPSKEFNQFLNQLAERKDLIILHEHLSNLELKNTVWNTDAVLTLLQNEQTKKFIPHIVITMGGQILSKKLKQFLKNKPEIHWDIPPDSGYERNWAMFGDMFDALASPINEIEFLQIILESAENKNSPYKEDWMQVSRHAETLSRQYFSQIPFCDLKVFEMLVSTFPVKANIQYGNSTPVRYSNFFPHSNKLTAHANRGTSGIDGCISTAAGAAFATQQLTICVVGDVSFFYDSNALWNKFLSPHLRIVVINNGGGNIFRLLNGPSSVKNFEFFFETQHPLSAKHIASMYGLPYYICATQHELEKALRAFYLPSALPQILEITTHGELNAHVYKEYFNFLITHK